VVWQPSRTHIAAAAGEPQVRQERGQADQSNARSPPLGLAAPLPQEPFGTAKDVFSDRCAAKHAAMRWAADPESAGQGGLGLVGFGPRYTSSLIGMIQAYPDLNNGRPAFLLVKGRLVGLAGLEPAPSSLSGITSRAPCYSAFLQAARLRKCRRDGVNCVLLLEVGRRTAWMEACSMVRPPSDPCPLLCRRITWWPHHAHQPRLKLHRGDQQYLR
jgi:hypothetical protein